MCTHPHACTHVLTHAHTHTHSHMHTTDTHIRMHACTHTWHTRTHLTHTHKHTWLVSGAGELTLLREENVSRSVWNGDADCGTGFRLIRTESDSLRPNAGLRSGSSESRVNQSSNETVHLQHICSFLNPVLLLWGPNTCWKMTSKEQQQKNQSLFCLQKSQTINWKQLCQMSFAQLVPIWKWFWGWQVYSYCKMKRDIRS